MKLNLKEAKEFLDSFNYDTITYQFLKSGKPAGYGINLTPKALAEHHKERKEIFFMVNEGDGKVRPGRKTARSQDNVTTLKALYIDTDDAPIVRVMEYLKSIDLRPHWIVESSPKKFHLYFLLEDIPAEASSIDAWKWCQDNLSNGGGSNRYQSDTSMTDFAKVLRVPGFYHLKGKPFRTRVRKHNTHPNYSLEEIAERLGYNEREENGYSNESYDVPEGKIGKGQRHYELTRFLGSLISKGVTREMATVAAEGFIRQKFQDAQAFIDTRWEEVGRFIDWKLEDLEKQETVNIVDLLEKTDDGRASFNDPFGLDDTFFFDAPGLVGDITQEICARARYPLPSFAFGAALSALGTLLSRTTTSELGHAPCNYFLCLAATGAGKNYAQEVLTHTFQDIGLSGLIQSGIRSDKGIAKFLEAHDGIGFLSIDEAEFFLSSFKDQRTPHHIRGCKSLLLEMYTSTNMPYKSLGQTGGQKVDEIILRYPRLSIMAHGVVHALHEAFNEKSIADGLLQRFIVLTSYRDRIRNPKFQPAGVLSSSIRDQLKSLALKAAYTQEDQLLEAQDLVAEIESANTEEKKAKLKKKLEKLTTKGTVRKNLVEFTPEARKAYNLFSDKLDELANQEIRKATGLEGLYTRGAEQVGRMATVMANPLITESIIDYLTTFMENQIESLKKSVKDNISNADRFNKEQQDLKAFVVSQLKANGGEAVPYRKIARKFYVRNPRFLKPLIESLVDSGDLVERTISTTSKGGRPGKEYYLGSLD